MTDIRNELAQTPNWRKSQYSTQNGCVVVGSIPTHVGIGDSKMGDYSPILPISRQQWAMFISATQSGRYDR